MRRGASPPPRCSPSPTAWSPARATTSRDAALVARLGEAGFEVVDQRVCADGVDDGGRRAPRPDRRVRGPRRHHRRHRLRAPRPHARGHPRGHRAGGARARRGDARRERRRAGAGSACCRAACAAPSGPALICNLPGSSQRARSSASRSSSRRSRTPSTSSPAAVRTEPTRAGIAERELEHVPFRRSRSGTVWPVQTTEQCPRGWVKVPTGGSRSPSGAGSPRAHGSQPCGRPGEISGRR